MTTRSSRYRFVLIDEGASLPMLYRQAARPSSSSFGSSGGFAAALPEVLPMTRPISALIEAFARLGRRGPGEQGWATPHVDDPLAFLLDSIHDAVVIRNNEGAVLYRNRAAERLPVTTGSQTHAAYEAYGVYEAYGRVVIGNRRFERRCMRIDEQPYQLIVEVLSELAEEG